MKLITLIIFLFPYYSSHALIFEVEGKYSSKSVEAENSGGDTGKLVSNLSFNPALFIGYDLSQSWYILYSLKMQSVDFNNANAVIEGDRKFTSTDQYLGIKWIFAQSIAFRLLYNMEQQYGFTVNANSKAEIFKENINYPTLYYDQILWLSKGYYFGMSLGLDSGGSSSTFTSRSGTRLGLFIAWSSFTVSAEFQNDKIETDDWTYITANRVYSISYRF